MSKIVEACESGLSISEIVESTGFSRTHVYRVLKKAGVDYKTRNPEQTVATVKELWENGLSSYLISKESGISRPHIYRILHNLGIDPSEHKTPFIPTLHHIEPLTERWKAQFCGFFYGEGCAMIVTDGRFLRPDMRIGLRADDVAALLDIQEKLGGGLSNRDYTNSPLNANPGVIWSIVSWSGCRAVIEATDLLSPAFPVKKLDDLRIFYEAILARFSMPYQLGESNMQTLMGFRRKLQEVKRFRL